MKALFVPFLRRDSLLYGLRCVTSYRALKNALRLSVDERFVTRALAAILDQQEDTLVRAVATRLGISYVDRIDPIDLRVLERTISAEQLLDAGVVPLVSEGVISALVVVCPFRARHVLRAFPPLPVFLASWSVVQRALNLSRPAAFGGIAERVGQGAEELIEHLLSDTVRSGRRQAQIRFGARAEYVIGDSEEGRAVSIHPITADMLYAFCSERGAAAEPHLSQNRRYVYAVSFRSAERAEIQLLCDLTSSIAEDSMSGTHQAAGAEVGHSRIIVLSDKDTSYVKVLSRALEASGFVVRTHGDTRQLTETLGAERASMVRIFDPEGLDCRLEQYLSELSSCAGLVALVSTRFCGSECSLLEKGVDLILPKSVDPQLLIAHLRRLFAANAMRRTA